MSHTSLSENQADSGDSLQHPPTGTARNAVPGVNRMRCPQCNHPAPHGIPCGYAITETWRDDVGFAGPPSGMERTDIVGTCHCCMGTALLNSDQPGQGTGSSGGRATIPDGPPDHFVPCPTDPCPSTEQFGKHYHVSADDPADLPWTIAPDPALSDCSIGRQAAAQQPVVAEWVDADLCRDCPSPTGCKQRRECVWDNTYTMGEHPDVHRSDLQVALLSDGTVRVEQRRSPKPREDALRKLHALLTDTLAAINEALDQGLL